MRRRKRKLRGRELKKHRKIIIISIISIFLLISVGYAAFSTTIQINVKGRAKGTTLATTKILNLKQSGDTTLIDDGTDDHNIRYSGKSVNNYVCLKNEKPCTENNLYRIIGVFNNIKSSENGTSETRVKLIRNDSIGKMKWDESGSNNWARPSTLNNYLNSLDIVNNDFVDNVLWNIGGSSNHNVTSSQAYIFERGDITNLNNEAPSTWQGKVALMYPSDYGFASKECYQDRQLWNNTHEDYRRELCRNSNWLLLDYGHEWIISPVANSNYRSFTIYGINGGYVHSVNAGVIEVLYVRPSFYLKPSVNILENGNDGSLSKPYILTN